MRIESYERVTPGSLAVVDLYDQESCSWVVLVEALNYVWKRERERNEKRIG